MTKSLSSVTPYESEKLPLVVPMARGWQWVLAHAAPWRARMIPALRNAKEASAAIGQWAWAGVMAPAGRKAAPAVARLHDVTAAWVARHWSPARRAAVARAIVGLAHVILGLAHEFGREWAFCAARMGLNARQSRLALRLAFFSFVVASLATFAWFAPSDAKPHGNGMRLVRAASADPDDMPDGVEPGSKPIVLKTREGMVTYYMVKEEPVRRL